MKIQGADLREHNRLLLQDVVPLPAPLSMYIEPTNACNIRCKFCPTGDPTLIKSVGRKAGILSWETFHKITASLKEFGKIRHINFFKDGEPLLNKNLPEMAQELRPLCEKLWLTTNGTVLTHDLSKRLAEAGFDMIQLSVIAPNAEGYKRIAGVNLDYDKFLENVAEFKSMYSGKLAAKLSLVHFTDEEVQKFEDDFEPITDYIFTNNLHSWSRMDLRDFRMGTQSDTFDGVPNIDRLVCTWPLYQMTVNWNGTVQPCNEDWSWVNIMGDVNDNTLPEIWRGETFNEFRRMHLRGLRKHNKACGTCYQVMSQLDNVDDYREEILQKYDGE